MTTNTTQTNEERAADMFRFYSSRYGFDLNDWPYKVAILFCTLMGTQCPSR